jgi:hypothetical protein
LYFLLSVKLFVLLERLQPYNKKGRKCELAAPSSESKGDTRATNAIAEYHNSFPESSEFLKTSITEAIPSSKS